VGPPYPVDITTGIQLCYKYYDTIMIPKKKITNKRFRINIQKEEKQLLISFILNVTITI